MKGGHRTKQENRWIKAQKLRAKVISGKLKRGKARDIIDSLIQQGYRVHEFTQAHFRFEEHFDVYTRSYRWHDLWTDERGDFVCDRMLGSQVPTLEEVVFARVAKPAKLT